MKMSHSLQSTSTPPLPCGQLNHSATCSDRITQVQVWGRFSCPYIVWVGAILLLHNILICNTLVCMPEEPLDFCHCHKNIWIPQVISYVSEHIFHVQQNCAPQPSNFNGYLDTYRCLHLQVTIQRHLHFGVLELILT